MLHSSEITGGGPTPALVIASYKEPWTASLWDGLQRFSVQLASAGGSGALAKTAVAPLERVRVCQVLSFISSQSLEAGLHTFPFPCAFQCSVKYKLIGLHPLCLGYNQRVLVADPPTGTGNVRSSSEGQVQRSDRRPEAHPST